MRIFLQDFWLAGHNAAEGDVWRFLSIYMDFVWCSKL